MLNQLQFPGMGDHRPQASQSPAGGSGVPQRPRDASDPHRGAQARLQANRDRILGKGNARTPDAPDIVHVGEYGLDVGTHEQVASTMPMVPVHENFSSDSTRQFQKFGETRWVNLVGDNAVRMAQREVVAGRVEQLRKDPDIGKDPRFPAGHASHMPNVLEVPNSRKDRGGRVPMVVQGTHRTAAARANGQLFMEARVIPREKSLDARYDRQAAEADPLLRQRRFFGQDTAWSRYKTGDVTLRGPVEA